MQRASMALEAAPGPAEFLRSLSCSWGKHWGKSSFDSSETPSVSGVMESCCRFTKPEVASSNLAGCTSWSEPKAAESPLFSAFFVGGCPTLNVGELEWRTGKESFCRRTWPDLAELRTRRFKRSRHDSWDPNRQEIENAHFQYRKRAFLAGRRWLGSNQRPSGPRAGRSTTLSYTADCYPKSSCDALLSSCSSQWR